MTARYHYTNTPLKVIGAAAGARPWTEWPYVRDTSFDLCEESLQLYKHYPDGSMVLLEEESFRITDTSRMMRFMGRSHFLWQEVSLGEREFFVPIYEVYFAHPHLMTDSFYIGCTFTPKDSDYYYDSYPVYLVWWWGGCGVNGTEGSAAFPVSINGENVWSFSRTSPNPRIPWLFPIIDTTGMHIIPECDTFICREVTDFRLSNPFCLESNVAELVWTGNPLHARWQVAYGPAGTAPEDCTVMDFAAPTASLYGIIDSSHHVAYVRGYCTTCDRWGDWGEGLEFWKGMNDTVGIAASALDLYTQLVPNPARDEVTVFSSFTVSKIEVYDLGGRLVLTETPDSLSAVFNVSALPAGLYIVSIRTPYGTTARRLAVE